MTSVQDIYPSSTLQEMSWVVPVQIVELKNGSVKEGHGCDVDKTMSGARDMTSKRFFNIYEMDQVDVGKEVMDGHPVI